MSTLIIIICLSALVIYAGFHTSINLRNTRKLNDKFYALDEKYREALYVIIQQDEAIEKAKEASRFARSPELHDDIVEKGGIRNNDTVQRKDKQYFMQKIKEKAKERENNE